MVLWVGYFCIKFKDQLVVCVQGAQDFLVPPCGHVLRDICSGRVESDRYTLFQFGFDLVNCVLCRHLFPVKQACASRCPQPGENYQESESSLEYLYL